MSVSRQAAWHVGGFPRDSGCPGERFRYSAYGAFRLYPEPAIMASLGRDGTTVAK